jgi:hypothetical protein
MKPLQDILSKPNDLDAWMNQFVHFQETRYQTNARLKEYIDKMKEILDSWAKQQNV